MKNFTIIIFLLANMNLFAQTTYVPDNNFEQALIDLGYDDVLDDYVLTANISGLTNLNVESKNINDLTGIQDFVSLITLHCSENQLTSLDISANTNLTNLSCLYNHLTSINVTSNTALINFYCSANQLSGIDISANINLKEFDCAFNPITSIDVSTNVNLTELGCYNNQLTNLNVSTNTNLESLYCSGNQLTSLDVSTNTNLFAIECQENNLASLDISLNTNLHELDCSENQLTSLNVRNGNNVNFSSFYASGNPNLTCIFVDDKEASYLNDWTIDDASTFVETQAECDALDIANILNNDFTIYPNPTKENFSINTNNKITNIKVYDIFGKLIKEYNKQNTYSVSDLSNGIYLIKVKTNIGSRDSKLVIE